MSRLLTLALVVFLTQVASAQKQSTKLPDPKKYAATITTEDLSKHLYIIAGAEMEGRETATEGQRKAAAYISSNSLNQLDFFRAIAEVISNIFQYTKTRLVQLNWW